MEFLLKKVQTLMGSFTVNIFSFVLIILGKLLNWLKYILIKPEYQYPKLIISLTLGIFGLLIITPTSANAIVDPLSVSNNKFGIHIITPSSEEASAAADLVNANGDWGYVTVLIESKDIEPQNVDAALNKWQTFFDDLRRRHLIPLVRIATQPAGDYWKRPEESDATAWAEFLNKLNWPVKNRYVIIYNEPNHAKEWGNVVDPVSFAHATNRTIDALKSKHPDFFVLNAGFDASTPHQPPNYMDQWIFMQQMNEAVPGIFSKLDGWVSHSYPNPGFVGLPTDSGRGTVGTWYWELQKLRELGVTKNLPVFITETGWKHSNGLKVNNSLPSPEKISEYFRIAFANAWNSDRIVAVTPFLLNYQQEPFDHFSFKKVTGEKQELRILGTQYPENAFANYHPHYLAIRDLPKTNGTPIQETTAELVAGSIYHAIAAGEKYQINLTFKNTGQSIWNDSKQSNERVKLAVIYGGQELDIKDVLIPEGKTIAPGETYTFPIELSGNKIGEYKVVFNLFKGDKPFDNQNFEFLTEVKSPVILLVKGALKWKDAFEGEYELEIKGSNGSDKSLITLSSAGISPEIKNHALLPDYTFDFTLKKPFYHSKTVRQEVRSGVNTIDFGTLEPNFFAAFFNPEQFWKVLPFSNK